jgi:hypothetical protein
MFFMAGRLSAANRRTRDTCGIGDARFNQGKGRSGAKPPTLSCNCLLAGRFRCFSFRINS